MIMLMMILLIMIGHADRDLDDGSHDDDGGDEDGDDDGDDDDALFSPHEKFIICNGIALERFHMYWPPTRNLCKLYVMQTSHDFG